MVLKDDRLTDAPSSTRRREARRRRMVLLGSAGTACLLLAGVLVVILVHGRTARRQQPAPPPASAPAGIVTVTAQTGIAGFVLAFHDPATGRVNRTAAVGVGGLTGPDLRRRFSPDFTLLAWVADDALHVAHLTPGGYAETASWKPEASDQYGTAYRDAVVNPVTGRVWFRRIRTAGTARSIQIVSIDPAVAGDEPRVEPVGDLPLAFDHTGAPATQRTVHLATDPDAHADLIGNDAEVLAGSVTLPGDVRYECPAALAPDTLACYASDPAPYGAVAKLRVNPTAQNATMSQLLAAIDPPVQGLLISPDRTQLRLRTVTGWLAASTTGTTGTQTARLDQPADTPLAWI